MAAAVPEPESQDGLLLAALACLTGADVPPDEADWAVPDPDTGRIRTQAWAGRGRTRAWR